MDASQILTELSVKIYSAPLSDLRTTGEIRNLSNPLCVIMLIIDLETEYSMNGIVNFLGNSTGVFAQETVQALRIIGCHDGADKLAAILEAAERAGMTHDAIQQDLATLEPYAVSSFSKVHGNKWDSATRKMHSLADTIDFRAAYELAEQYIDLHRDLFLAALNHSGSTAGKEIP